MSYDVQILRAMMRLARKREAANVDALQARAGGTAAEVRDAWRRLDAQGLVERLADERARLTMDGFAIALATIAMRTSNKRRAPGRRTTRAA